ncbi:MAG: TrbC/VirB2 family protein [Acidobacteriia bacterium]|nr:TrbC/VirB2 family protein [Terriglobia bacterium]
MTHWTTKTTIRRSWAALRMGAYISILSAATPLAVRAASPWENAVDVLQTAFTGPIARGLSLVAIVVGGLMFAFGEGESKRMLAGIVFGIGMAIGAVNFMAWLFP